MQDFKQSSNIKFQIKNLYKKIIQPGAKNMSNEKNLSLDELLAKESETHDSHIQFLLCRYYEDQKDYENSFFWAQKSAEQNDGDGMARLGVHYLHGWNCEENQDKCFELAKKSSELSSAWGNNLLGICYDNGIGTEEDLEQAFKYFKLSAEAGNKLGQRNLGNFYLDGEVVEEDFEEAVKWFRLSSDQGYSVAQRSLGDCYYNGEGVDQDFEEAVKYYKLAADQGDAHAQYNLANCYVNGEGVEKNLDEAYRLYKQAAEQGFNLANQALVDLVGKEINTEKNLEEYDEDPIGRLQRMIGGLNFLSAQAMQIQEENDEEDPNRQNSLGEMYYYGHGVEQNYETAFKWYKRSAENGNADSQNKLGYMYSKGEGTEQNFTEAVKWWKQAAAQYESEAAFNLGIMYYAGGDGIEKDEKESEYWLDIAANNGYAKDDIADYFYNVNDFDKAIKWYKSSAEEGNLYAQKKLGYIYYNGEGIEQNYEEAFRWYKMAAYEDDSYAQMILSIMYNHGYGIDENKEEALYWCKRAADQGDAGAQNRFGCFYFDGEGVEQDYEEAVKWFKLSAEQENNLAQYNLADCYYYGKGVEEDKEEAECWFEKASENGYEKSKIANFYYNADDNEKAFKWYKRSFEEDNDEYAAIRLGKFYFTGTGCTQDKSKAKELFEQYATDGSNMRYIGNLYLGEKEFEKAFKWYSKSAEKGNGWSIRELGELYYLGKGCSQDKAKAEALFKQYATEGYYMNQIGDFYSEHDDFEIAFEWYSKAVENDDNNDDNWAAINLGKLYYQGKGCTQDKAKAEALFKQYATDGSDMNEIGDFYSEQEDFENAFYWYSQAVENDSTSAAFEIGKLYYQGQGCTQDKAKAEECFDIAVSGEYIWEIALFYYDNEDYEKSIKYLKLIDEDLINDDSNNYEEFDLKHAQFLTGLFYTKESVVQDFTKAIEYFKLALNNGIVSAAIELGKIYYEGKGVKQDKKQAEKWFEYTISDDFESEDDYALLEDYDYFGYFVEIPELYYKNGELQKAREWYEKFVNNDVYELEQIISNLEDEGKSDFSLELCKLFAAKGDKYAKEKLEELKKKTK